MKYRKRTAVIEAMQYKAGEIGALQAWAGEGAITQIWHDSQGDCAYVKTVEGRMRVMPGDYIIRSRPTVLGNVQDVLFPCRREVFERTYEEVPS